MFIRALNLLLLAAACAGAWLTWQATAENASLRQEYMRLVKVAGNFKVTDKSKIHVMLLDQGPGRFAWRVYVPPNVALGHQTQLFRSAGGGGRTRPSTEAKEYVFRWQFRTDGNRVIEQRRTGSGGSAGFSSGGGEGYASLLEHWEELEIDVAGDDKVAVFEPKEIVTLLHIRVPGEVVIADSQGVDTMFIRLGDMNTKEWLEMVAKAKADRLSRYNVQKQRSTEADHVE